MTKTYLQLAREIATLQAAAEKQLAAEKKEAVAQLNEIIEKYELSAADLKFPGVGTSSATRGAKAKPADRPAAAGAKYADGTGNIWGGRGPRPAWLRNAIAAGKTLESFSQSVMPAAQPATAVASATAGSGKKAGFTVAPKYRHPVTGDTWSGRGSAPRWLKEALRKRGTKLDAFLIAKPAGGSAGSQSEGSVVASQRKASGSTKPAHKPVVPAKRASVKASAPNKAAVKNSGKAPSSKAAAAPTKKAAAKRAATKAVVSSRKATGKAVAVKKTPARTPPLSGSASVPAAAASNAPSETSPVV